MLLKTFLAMNGITKQPGDSPIPLHAKQAQAAKETNKNDGYVMGEDSEEQDLLDKLDFAISNPISMDEKEFVSLPFKFFASLSLKNGKPLSDC